MTLDRVKSTELTPPRKLHTEGFIFHSPIKNSCLACSASWLWMHLHLSSLGQFRVPRSFILWLTIIGDISFFFAMEVHHSVTDADLWCHLCKIFVTVAATHSSDVLKVKHVRPPVTIARFGQKKILSSRNARWFLILDNKGKIKHWAYRNQKACTCSLSYKL